MATRKSNCPCGTNPVRVTDTKAKFCHERIKDPKKFDPKSFRTKVYRAHRITFGCKKGKYIKGKCTVPVQIQAILHPVGEAKCPTPGAIIKKNPFLEKSIITNIINNKKEKEITKDEYRRLKERTIGKLYHQWVKDYGFMRFTDWEKKVLHGDIILKRNPFLETSLAIATGITAGEVGKHMIKRSGMLNNPKSSTLALMAALPFLPPNRKKKNPGAKWHEDKEIYNDDMESKMRGIKEKEAADYFFGKKIAHRESKQIARRMGINPMYHGRAKLEAAALRLYKSGWGVDSVIMELKKKFDVPSSVAEYIARRAARISRGEEKENPKVKCPSKNPVKGATKIYDQILSIEAKKGKDSNFPNENFRHDFSSKDAEILGMPDGSLKVISKTGKRLWKNFDYPEKGKK